MHIRLLFSTGKMSDETLYDVNSRCIYCVILQEYLNENITFRSGIDGEAFLMNVRIIFQPL